MRCPSCRIDDHLGFDGPTIVAPYAADHALAKYEFTNRLSCLNPDSGDFPSLSANYVFDQAAARAMPLQANVEGLSQRAGWAVGLAVGKVPRDITAKHNPVGAKTAKIVGEAKVQSRKYLLATIEETMKVITLRNRLMYDRAILDFVALEDRYLLERL
jgi:hypothetical protein